MLGQLAHRGNVIFGPALIEAYKLERDVAKYPRIIATPEAVPYLNPLIGTDITNTSYAHPWNFRKDRDGMWYVDILGFYGELEKIFRRKAPNHEYLISLVKDKRVKDADDLGRVAKHTWMLNYLEETLAECNLYVRPADESQP